MTNRILSASALVPALIFLLLLASEPGLRQAHALTDEEYRKLADQSPAFRAAEKELNAAWKNLMSRLTGDRKQAARQAQRDWVMKHRSNEAGIISSAQGISLAEAYAQATSHRTGHLKDCLNDEPGVSGIYRDDGMGYLAVRQKQPGSIEFSLHIAWPSQQCSGSITQGLAVLVGRTAIFTDSGCTRLTFVFSENEVEVREEGACEYHGLNCRFEGTYTRTP